MEDTDALLLLADPTRFRIIELLSGRNYCVGALACILGISAPAVSQQLKILQGADLVSAERNGYHIHYSVNRALLHRLAARLSAIADTPLLPCERQGTRCGADGMKRCQMNRLTSDSSASPR